MTTKQKAYIIAEAGVNHNGDITLAYQLVDQAVAAGVNAVKFQTFKAKQLVARHAPKAAYQTRTTDSSESQLEMIEKLELTERDHEHLVAYCAEKKIEFLSTPFDQTSLVLLTDRFGLSTIKVSSGDLTNAPFLLDIARRAKKVIISTGMSTLAEIEAALGVLAFGFVASHKETPSMTAFEQAYGSEQGHAALQQRVAVLHCTTEYPAPVDEVNLKAMDTLAQAFGLTTGYSDHTDGIHIPIAAVARGARIIEKHFTLDRSLPGPDHKASLDPDALKRMVQAIRDIERALGDGVKRPTASEWKNRIAARKSLVAQRDTQSGEALVVACKRPGSGVSPFRYWDYAQTCARRDYVADELIDG